MMQVLYIYEKNILFSSKMKTFIMMTNTQNDNQNKGYSIQKQIKINEAVYEI